MPPKLNIPVETVSPPLFRFIQPLFLEFYQLNGFINLNIINNYSKVNR